MHWSAKKELKTFVFSVKSVTEKPLKDNGGII